MLTSIEEDKEYLKQQQQKSCSTRDNLFTYGHHLEDPKLSLNNLNVL